MIIHSHEKFASLRRHKQKNCKETQGFFNPNRTSPVLHVNQWKAMDDSAKRADQPSSEVSTMILAALTLLSLKNRMIIAFSTVKEPFLNLRPKPPHTTMSLKFEMFGMQRITVKVIPKIVPDLL